MSKYGWPLKSISRWLGLKWASLVAQMVKNPPAKQETQIRSLGQEDSLEKEMAPHSSLQYTCLENPMDIGAWWATAHGSHN